MDEKTSHSNHGNIDRRAFIKTGILAGGAVVLTGVPLTTYFISPALNKAEGKWIDFGSTEALETGTFSMLSYEYMVKDGWLVLPQRGFVWARTGSNGSINVFSSTCTHLACNVIWSEDGGVFECPCHSGRFDSDGHPIAGPPTKSLTALEHKIEDGNLMVHLTI